MKKVLNFLGLPLTLSLGTCCLLTLGYFLFNTIDYLFFATYPFIVFLLISLVISISYIIVGIMRSRGLGGNKMVDSGQMLLYRGLLGIGISFFGLFSAILTLNALSRAI
jgi:hypothetical protein